MFRAFAYIASLPPLWTNGDWEFVKQFVCKNSAICKVFLFWDFYQVIGLWQLRIIKTRAFSYSKSAMIKREYLHNSSQCAPALLFQTQTKKSMDFLLLYCSYIWNNSKSVEKNIWHQASKKVILKKHIFFNKTYQ